MPKKSSTLNHTQTDVAEVIPPLHSVSHHSSKRANPVACENAEDRFKEITQVPMAHAARIGTADVVVGVPFYNEAHTLAKVLETARKGLAEFYPNKKSVLVAAGSPAGEEALNTIGASPDDQRGDTIAFLLTNDECLDGKGWSTRAIIDIADYLGADLALLEADVTSHHRNGDVEGLSPEWIRLLIEPIVSGEMDLVVSRFNRHYLEAPVSNLTYPLFAAVYGCPIHRLTGGHWGIAHHLLARYRSMTSSPGWHTKVSGHGIDAWLATVAITSDARVCEANMGVKLHHHRSRAKGEMILRQVTEVLFDRIVNDAEWWKRSLVERKAPIRTALPSFGIPRPHRPKPEESDSRFQIAKYKDGCHKFHRIYEKAFPEEVLSQLVKLSESEDGAFDFPPHLWAQTVYGLILTYAFDPQFARDDIVSAAIPLYEGFEASRAQKLLAMKSQLDAILPEERVERMLSLEAESAAENLVTEFLQQRPAFVALWDEKAEALKPPVPQITYREFVPGVPLLVPPELKSARGNIVSANSVYDSIFTRQKQEFEQFVYERLQVTRQAGSLEMAEAIKRHLMSIEERILPSSDLSTIEGTRELATFVFDNFPRRETSSLMPEMASWFVWQYRPTNLFTMLGYANLADMLVEYDPLDVMALAYWSEEREYVQGMWRLIADNIRSEHFAGATAQPVVVSHEDFPSLVEMKDSSALDKLTARIVVSNLHKGMGGEFPKLRYLLTIAKNLVEAEWFGRIWQIFAHERKDFGQKIINSLQNHWGKEPLSAHNVFEDSVHRAASDRLKRMAAKIASDANGDATRLILAEGLKDVADSYHLALTLADGTFMTCSAWSWASYSFKGGRALPPPPLSLHVERDSFSRLFLMEYFRAIGGTNEQVQDKVVELMGQGREWENLGPILLGREAGAEEVCMEIITPPPKQPPAVGLTRYQGNPILEPIKEHYWESRYVLNSGVVRIAGRVYLVYRAYGDDSISRLGLAVSDDGFKFTERLSKPIFQPENKSEERGCEDPRLVLMDDRIYMTYTAYDGIVAQIALASIGVKDFLNFRWGAWHRHGLVFPGYTDKDAALFPEMFGGKYAMLHRVDPHMWVTFSTHLRCPWPRKEHKILAGSTSGMMWDGKKIGAGTQPIKTKYGWLLITHGVDYAHVYRLGVMLLDLANPSKMVYRSPNFVLEPEEECEKGGDECQWVPNVVFTCGALPREEGRDILEANDELIVYYGAADTVMCIATGTVGQLIPEKFRG